MTGTEDPEVGRRLEGIDTRDVEFASMRDPASPASLERRIVVTAPPALVELTATGDPRVLEGLVELLGDADRAWAAQVALAAMTRRDEKAVAAFARTPDEWLESVGPGAQGRWRAWLEPRRDRLVWDAERQMFTEPD